MRMLSQQRPAVELTALRRSSAGLSKAAAQQAHDSYQQGYHAAEPAVVIRSIGERGVRKRLMSWMRNLTCLAPAVHD